MSKLIFEANGVRGRSIRLYDTKCIIKTTVTVGSIFTGNASDGEKTIFLKDVVGVQFKPSGGLIGFLQLETPSMQMNNQNSNMFSENTFTFDNSCGLTNQLMERVYQYVVDRVEELKYGLEPTATLSLPAPAPAPLPGYSPMPAAYPPPAYPAPAPYAPPPAYPTPAPPPSPTGNPTSAEYEKIPAWKRVEMAKAAAEAAPPEPAPEVPAVWYCTQCGARNEPTATTCINCNHPK